MTKPAHGANQHWPGFLLAALVAVLATLFGAGTASAAPAAPAARTRAGAPSVESQVVLLPRGCIDSDRLGRSTSTYDSVLAAGEAAEDPVAAAPRLALEYNYDVAASSYDALVLFVDAPTVPQVPAVGHHTTGVSIGRPSRVALFEYVAAATAAETATVAEEGASVAVNGETAATALGRATHAAWDYGPGFEKEFTLEAGGRVDAINFETREVVELKPNNPRQIRLGGTQLDGYIAKLNAEFPGAPWTGRLVRYGP